MRLGMWQPEYPGAFVFPADDSNTLGPPAYTPTTIVLHTPEEPADDKPNTPIWFAQYHPNQAGSTNAFASFLGFIFECVPPGIAPIANGVTPDRQYPADAAPGWSLNRQSRSIEIEGYAATIGQTCPRGSGQWMAVVKWCAFLCQKYGIPADRAHIIGHYEVASNRSDPGTLNINWIVEDVQKQLNSEEDDMFTDEDRAILKQLIGPGDNMVVAAVLDGIAQSYAAGAGATTSAAVRKAFEAAAEKASQLSANQVAIAQSEGG